MLQVDSRPSRRPTRPGLECEVVQVKLNELRLHHPRQWGACWLALTLWEQLELDRFWRDRLPASRQGTKWLEVLKTQVCYQLIDPGSEWRLHRHWYAHSAMRDLLGSPVRVLSDNTLYRCLDKLLAHKRAFFSFLRQRWEVLFQARFDVLLYDLTSTYFESDPPFAGKRQFGYSRDKRSDCVQVVIALVVTPQGFPLAYEVMPGNTSDKTTLKDFLKQIEAQYGRSDRVWIMDRGIPTEETLEQMRTGDSPVHYLVGTPKGRLSKFEKKFLTLPWQAVRPSVDVKLLSHDSELYILARSHPRTLKERAMRRRRLKKLWRRLHELQQQTLTRDALLLKLGAAKKEAGRAYHLVDIQIPDPKQPVTPETFTFSLRRDKLRTVRRREGRYLLRSNLRHEDVTPKSVQSEAASASSPTPISHQLTSDVIAGTRGARVLWQAASAQGENHDTSQAGAVGRFSAGSLRPAQSVHEGCSPFIRAFSQPPTRPRHLVAILHPPHRGRAGIQRAETRPRHPSHLSPDRQAHRGSHLYRLHRLLLARDAETARPLLRPRTHTAGGAGEVRNDADGGRALAHHRRAPVGVAALHTTGP